MPLIGGFIGLVIILGVGTLILGNSTMNCTGLSGYNTTTPAQSTGWADACLDTNTNAQSAYALLLVAVIVFAAVIILSIVRLLG
jgi:murein tripeptide amidase MpaA